MAYTNPQQWLDLLRRRPGTRVTDLGVGSNVLEATGIDKVLVHRATGARIDKVLVHRATGAR